MVRRRERWGKGGRAGGREEYVRDEAAFVGEEELGPILEEELNRSVIF